MENIYAALSADDENEIELPELTDEPSGTPQIISRQDAIALGYSTYYTGIPCKKAGHICQIYVSKNRCVQCVKIAYRKAYESDPLKFNVRGKAWRQTQPEYSKEYARQRRKIKPDEDKKYYLNNAEKIKATSKKRRKEKPEEVKAAQQRHYAVNKEKVLNACKQYRKDHPGKHNEYYKQRRKTDPLFRLLILQRDYVYRAVKGTLKEDHSIEYLGCTLLELHQHLERLFKLGMTWENAGKVWEIDHIEPLCAINPQVTEDLKRVLHYTNLQPLFKPEHHKKSAEDRKKSIQKQIKFNPSLLYADLC